MIEAMRASRIALGMAIFGPLIVCSLPLEAHRRWGDGSPVSDEIEKLCCGEADAHLLPPGSVHARADGWHIDGYPKVVPFGKELPSPDGDEWGFWSDHQYNDGYKIIVDPSEMRCLFLNPRIL